MANIVNTYLFPCVLVIKEYLLADKSYRLKNKCLFVLLTLVKAADSSYRISYPTRKTGLFKASFFLSCSFYPSGNTALWNLILEWEHSWVV